MTAFTTGLPSGPFTVPSNAAVWAHAQMEKIKLRGKTKRNLRNVADMVLTTSKIIVLGIRLPGYYKPQTPQWPPDASRIRVRQSKKPRQGSIVKEAPMFHPEAIRFSFHALRPNKFRSFLTALGLVI